MKIAPGLTLWGPLEAPEMAEVMAAPVDELVRVLRGAADVLFVDTSTFWGDCVASLVASCDRCLVVGAPGACAVSSSIKAMGLASRVGVPGTKMTGVFNRFGGEGVYLLDEPEAALSPARQLTLLGQIHQLVGEDSQFLIATHSPILMAYPGAYLYLLSEGGIQRVDYRETEHYLLTKRFLEDPERMLRYLFSEDDTI